MTADDAFALRVTAASLLLQACLLQAVACLGHGRVIPLSGLFAVPLACLNATNADNSVWSVLLPWVWPIVGLVLQLPLLAMVPACGIGLVCCVMTDRMWQLSGLLMFVIVQLADERVRSRRQRVELLQENANDRLQGVADNLMPPFVVDELRHLLFGPSLKRRSLVCHSYDLVTVLQADLAGFTAFARHKPPEEVVCIVNGLFSIFDYCVGQRGVYKMETIGDAYVCVSGMYGQQHSASSMVLTALDFTSALANYKVRCNLPTESLGVRSGIHSGECVAGVIGTTMLRYHLFGRTMHIVEVLESTSPVSSIHFSETTMAQVNSEHGEGQQACRAAMSTASLLEREPHSVLVTSKGEQVAPEDIDGLGSFFLSAVASVEPQEGREHTEAGSQQEQSSGAAGSREGSTQEVQRQQLGKLDQSSLLGSRRILEQLDLAVSWHAAVKVVANSGDTSAQGMTPSMSRNSQVAEDEDFSDFLMQRKGSRHTVG
eukprot:CAMPEP_0183415950 /NCGR_PEP_ID=MMETSP0370-20130417/23443_1 /TAXON_ID=268820 /ORGANISM="Peridinium aciculiferum, Strain PAER-2" /LENGTH=486 /DNA_ID=CAMNT_0025599423 /DNA_START=11 /DNA_END=1471 /DNA_ORIENTATION=+